MAAAMEAITGRGEAELPIVFSWVARQPDPQGGEGVQQEKIALSKKQLRGKIEMAHSHQKQTGLLKGN